MATQPKTKTRRRSTSGEYPFPTVKLDGQIVPDVLKMKREDGMKWDDIAVAIHRAGFEQFRGHNLIRLGYRLELLRDPSLAIDPNDADAIVAARDEAKLRWDRIAVYAGKGEASVRTIYEKATKIASDTDYVGRGRRFPPMDERKPVGYRTSMVQVDGKWVPKDGATPAKPKARRTRRTRTAAK